MRKPASRAALHRAVGAFVLVGAVGLIGVTVLALRAESWFRPMHRITLVLPPEGSFGLRSGADVEMLGTRVGAVRDIAVDEQSGRMTAAISVRSDFARFIGSDSTALIRKRFVVGGDSFVEISRSTQPDARPIPPRDATLDAAADRGSTDKLEQAIEEVRARAVPAIEDLHATITEFRDLARNLNDRQGPTQKLLTNLNELADRLRDPERPAQKLIAHLERISNDIAEGRGAIGRLVADEKWANEIDASLQRLTGTLTKAEQTLTTADESVKKVGELAASLNESSKELPQTIRKTTDVLTATEGAITELRGASSRLPRLVDALTDGAETLPGLVLQSQATLHETERLIKGMQQHWLLRDYVAADRAPARIGDTP